MTEPEDNASGKPTDDEAAAAPDVEPAVEAADDAEAAPEPDAAADAPESEAAADTADAPTASRTEPRGRGARRDGRRPRRSRPKPERPRPKRSRRTPSRPTTNPMPPPSHSRKTSPTRSRRQSEPTRTSRTRLTSTKASRRTGRRGRRGGGRRGSGPTPFASPATRPESSRGRDRGSRDGAGDQDQRPGVVCVRAGHAPRVRGDLPERDAVRRRRYLPAAGVAIARPVGLRVAVCVRRRPHHPPRPLRRRRAPRRVGIGRALGLGSRAVGRSVGLACTRRRQHLRPRRPSRPRPALSRARRMLRR